jgi:hypothetical protein
MNNKTYYSIQIIILASLILAVAIQVLLFFNVSDRMTPHRAKAGCTGTPYGRAPGGTT